MPLPEAGSDASLDLSWATMCIRFAAAEGIGDFSVTFGNGEDVLVRAACNCQGGITLYLVL